MTQTSELHNVLKAGQFQVKESILFTTGIKNLRPLSFILKNPTFIHGADMVEMLTKITTRPYLDMTQIFLFCVVLIRLCSL